MSFRDQAEAAAVAIAEALPAPPSDEERQEIVMIVSEEEADLLFNHLQKEGVHIFYVRTSVEFGMMGKPDR